MRRVDRRNFLTTTALFGSAMVTSAAWAQQTDPKSEPVYRISKNDSQNPALAPEANAHPLDPALVIAHKSLDHIRSNIADYSAIVIKRERVNGTLGEHEFMYTKVRNRKHENGAVRVPFSVYMNFLKPASVKGREVIYVEGANGGNITAHEGGMKGRFLPTMNLDPHGMIAMQGQRYPITDFGFENLVVKLIEKGERDRKHGECTVEFRTGAQVEKDRPCTVLVVTHPVPRQYFDFHVAEIFIDDKLNIPVRYAAYSWPAQEGGEKELLEEYTYRDIKLNLNMTNADFDPKNTKYNF
jgi:Protein of unknown function (DUF1571)